MDVRGEDGGLGGGGAVGPRSSNGIGFCWLAGWLAGVDGQAFSLADACDFRPARHRFVDARVERLWQGNPTQGACGSYRCLVLYPLDFTSVISNEAGPSSGSLRSSFGDSLFAIALRYRFRTAIQPIWDW